MKKTLKWTGILLGGLIGLLLVAVAVLYLVSSLRMNRTYAAPSTTLAVPTDEATLTHGHHIAVIRGCIDCHGEDLGGGVFIDEPPVARLSASNLTRGRGGVAATYTDADWERAVRHGIGPDGKPLLFMPSHEYNTLSDTDMGALIAYLKSVAPVDRELPSNRVGPLGRLLYLTGELPLVPAELIDHQAPLPEAPPPGPTAAYGAYLATSCTGCHGADFSGGEIPGTPPGFPPATNLTPDPETGLGTWSDADFMRALREGVRPDGSAIDPVMPWRTTQQMTDDEIQALWLYLQRLPPRPEGNR